MSLLECSSSHTSKPLPHPHSWTEQSVFSCKRSHVYPSNESEFQLQEKASPVNSTLEWEVKHCLKALEHCTEYTRVNSPLVLGTIYLDDVFWPCPMKGRAATTVWNCLQLKGNRKEWECLFGAPSPTVRAIMKMIPNLPLLTWEGRISLLKLLKGYPRASLEM